jgi:hypothetical protein
MKKKFILILTAVALTGLIIYEQASLLRLTGASWKKENMTWFPGDERIKPAFLGFETTVAHYLWIRTIIYFGGHYVTDGDYKWLINMVDIITKLDPYFYPAYEFAGLIVPDKCKNPDAARVILQRGLTYLGNKKWNISFYLGMLYFEHYNDKETAARYISLASKVPSEQSVKLAGIAASFYNQAGKRNIALEYLAFMYQTSESPDAKRYLLNKITQYRNMNSNELVD